MSVMLAELYDALRAAGAPDDQARRAAEAVASYDKQYTDLRGQFTELRGAVDRQFAEARGEVSLLKWMVGFNLALTVAVAIKLFVP